jgi:hypothetical protein
MMDSGVLASFNFAGILQSDPHISSIGLFEDYYIILNHGFGRTCTQLSI